MTVKFLPNDTSNPPGKLADAELYFSGGPLDGLKLVGFAVWERKHTGGRNVTFPARQYSVKASGGASPCSGRQWTRCTKTGSKMSFSTPTGNTKRRRPPQCEHTVSGRIPDCAFQLKAAPTHKLGLLCVG